MTVQQKVEAAGWPVIIFACALAMIGLCAGWALAWSMAGLGDWTYMALFVPIALFGILVSRKMLLQLWELTKPQGDV